LPEVVIFVADKLELDSPTLRDSRTVKIEVVKDDT